MLSHCGKKGLLVWLLFVRKQLHIHKYICITTLDRNMKSLHKNYLECQVSTEAGGPEDKIAGSQVPRLKIA